MFCGFNRVRSSRLSNVVEGKIVGGQTTAITKHVSRTECAFKPNRAHGNYETSRHGETLGFIDPPYNVSINGRQNSVTTRYARPGPRVATSII